MKFTVNYKLVSIPCEGEHLENQTFTFTYTASISDLGDLSNSIHIYLQKFFNKGNYELLGFELNEEDRIKNKESFEKEYECTWGEAEDFE